MQEKYFARSGGCAASKDISDQSQGDVTLRYRGSLPKPAVPAYYEMDLRWMWALRPVTQRF
jgi:iron complex outermembrane receptor protein